MWRRTSPAASIAVIDYLKFNQQLRVLPPTFEQALAATAGTNLNSEVYSNSPRRIAPIRVDLVRKTISGLSVDTTFLGTIRIIYSDMFSITDLPKEILERIFLKGCEDDLAEDDEAFRDRDPRPHLKPFVALASRVCHFWRQLITSPGVFQQTHYRIAELSLTLSSRRDSRLVRNCILFKTSLSKTYGCDIVILFDIPVNSDWPIVVDEDGELISQEEFKTNLKLFLHLLHAVVPYQQQILSVRMHTVHPEVVGIFWQLLTFNIREAPRLVEVVVTRHEPKPDASPLLASVSPSLLAHDLLPKLWEVPGRSCSYSLEHLISLDTMALTDAVPWLENPSHIFRLTFLLTQPLAVIKLLDIFHMREDIAGNLTSLEITRPATIISQTSESFSRPPAFTDSESHRKITFRGIRYLRLKLEFPIMKFLLDQTQYPSIEVAMITLISHTELLPSNSSPVDDHHVYNGSAPEDVESEQYVILQGTHRNQREHLVRKTLQPDKFLALLLSKYFSHSNRLTFRIPNERPSGGSGLRLDISRVELPSHLERSATFVPGSISVNCIDYRTTFQCLRALELSHVQFLQFERSTYDSDMFRFAFGSKSYHFSVERSIKMPSLQTLVWYSNLPNRQCLEDHFQFLFLLEVPALQVVDLESDNGDLELESYLMAKRLEETTHTFPLVHRLNYVLPASTSANGHRRLRQILGLFPQAQTLHLKLRGFFSYKTLAHLQSNQRAPTANPYPYTDESQPFGRPKGLTFLSKMLAPSEEGYIPLSKMSSLDLKFDIEPYNFRNHGGILIEQVRTELTQLFEDCAGYGAVHLALQGHFRYKMGPSSSKLLARDGIEVLQIKIHAGPYLETRRTT